MSADLDGTIRDGYAKNLLIPLAEYVPLASLIPAVEGWFPHVQEFGAATDTPALHLGAWRIATPICYEAVRPEFVRRMARASRPHLLVTLANDAWFGHSQEPWLHLALARLRAVEHRRFLVRSTNSGVSAFIDPVGRVISHTGTFEPAAQRAELGWLKSWTPYQLWGDAPWWLLSLLIVAAGFVGPERFDRRPAALRKAPRAAKVGARSSPPVE